MFRAFLAMAAIVALIMSAKDGVLADLGLVSSCRPVPAPLGTKVEWRTCSSGTFDGHPDLTKQLCVSRGKVGAVEYWVCPFEQQPVSPI
jgi:hypothetical protein